MEASYLPRAYFGPIVTSIDVDELVLDTLRTWLPTYLTRMEAERDLEVGRLTRPSLGSYASVIDDEQFPDYNLPSIIVTTAQTEGDPVRDGEGMYSADWNVVVSAIVRGRSPKETRDLAGWFEGSVRRCLVQKGIAEDDSTEDCDLVWRGSNVAPVSDPTGAGRYIAAGMGHYIVQIDHVVQQGVGPHDGEYPADPEQPDVPYEGLVTVGKVSVDIQHKT